ncbi:MAG: glycosyltransferase [Actinomycetaceae bacterium]|nr:glycosyltransferase [Actinomycetaceae bacterium]MDY6082250.1 glycosyltransferase [Actinomycetaceae bacterium]
MDLKYVAQQAIGGFSAVAHMIADDPGLFAIQLSRRVPTRIQQRLTTLIPPSQHRFIQIAHDFVARDLPAIADDIGSDPHNSFEANMLAAAGYDPGLSFPAAHARWLRQIGRIPEAIEAAPPRLRRRIGSVAITQVPGYSLRVTPKPECGLNPRPKRDREFGRGQDRLSKENDRGNSQGVRNTEGEQPLRVLHILTNSLPATQSGYSLRSHAVLRAQRAAGIDARAATRYGYPLTVGRILTERTQTIDGVPYYRLISSHWPHTLPERLAEQARLLLDLVDSLTRTEGWTPDLIHTTTPYRNGLVAKAVAQALGIPWVYEVRGEQEKTWLSKVPEQFRDDASISWHFRTLHAQEQRMIEAADAVIALSEVQKRNFAARGVSAEKISVVPNAMWSGDIGRTLTTRQARAELNLPLDATIIGSVSSVVEYEGFDTALQALRILLDEDLHREKDRAEHAEYDDPHPHDRAPHSTSHNWFFVLVGDGTDLPRLKRIVAHSGSPLADHVVFAGKVPAGRAAVWYQALDCFVIPRIDSPVTRAVTPMKGLQAAAFGVPMVASDVPALAEVTPDAPAGFVVTPADADALAHGIMQAITTAKTDPNKMREAALGFAHAHTWEINAARYAKVYEQLA